MAQKTHPCKDFSSPQLTYGFSEIPIKIPTYLFVETEKSITMNKEMQRAKYTQDVFSLWDTNYWEAALITQSCIASETNK